MRLVAVEFQKGYHTKEVGVSPVSQCAFKPPSIYGGKVPRGRRRHERVAPLHLQAVSHPQPQHATQRAQLKMMGELVRQPGGAGDHSCRQGRRQSRLVAEQFELALPQPGGDTLRAAGGTK